MSSSDQSNVRVVRVFVSSPADVKVERQRIDQVAKRLNHAFDGRVKIEAVRWEERIYSSHTTFQAQIIDAAQCDLVIAIFWSRLGTPLPEQFARMESGERYPSGTAYEVLSALEARKKGDRPDVYVFRKTAPPASDSEEARGQRKDLTAFFARWFQTPDGQFLRAYHRFSGPDEFEALVERLLNDWVAVHVPRDSTRIWPFEVKGSPFRALLPFDAKHAAIFFGRDRKVTRAIEQLQSVGQARRSTRAGPRNVPFLLIVGESGSGKSSLMRAGLAPRLTAPGVVPTVDVWRTAIARIGDDPNPFLTLANALLVARDDEHGFGAAVPELRDQGVQSPGALADLLAEGADFDGGRRKRAPAGKSIIKALEAIQAEARRHGGFERRLHANLLLLVDQLENIFAASITDAQRSAFARLLFALCATRRVWVAATLRSDIYPRVITPGDFLALKDAGGVYDLAAPGESELTEIVHLSAAAAGLSYEANSETGERLDERILKDAQGKNTLPLLQFALDRLFQQRQVVDGEVRLTYSAYEAMHGLDGAINQTAETALATLGKTEIEALPRLLRCLAVPARDPNLAHTGGNELMVRTIPWKEAIPNETTAKLVHALTDSRIIVATGSEDPTAADDGGAISVSHQRVFESWERARRIIAEHKDFFRIRDEVEAECDRWRRRGRPTALLLAKGVPLAEAQQIVKAYGAELKRDILAYVATSNRRAQRLNIFMGPAAAVFAVLFVAASVLGVIANRAQLTATKNYDASKDAMGRLVGVITQGLQNIQGIQVQTVQNVLSIVDPTIQAVQSISAGDPQLSDIRAELYFQIGKVFQKKESHADAIMAANQSLDIRSVLTHFDQFKSAPAMFNASPAQLRWELSLSLEFVGDLFREERKDADARSRFGDTLAIRRELVVEQADDEDWAQGLSQIYTRLGDLDSFSNLAKALEDYQSSLSIAADFFLRKIGDDRWQRELSWALNKVGDVKLKTVAAAPAMRGSTVGDPDVAAALSDFTDSLCLRRQISARDPTKTELKRDIPYTLDRVGNAKVKLGDGAGAANAYFESLALRREIAASVDDNALYLGDVAVSLTLIGDFDRDQNDLKTALAFYAAASDVRLKVTLLTPTDDRAGKSLSDIRKKVDTLRNQVLDADPDADLSGNWWQGPVADAEKAHVKPKSPSNIDGSACLNRVVATVDQIVAPASTGSVR